ncbi:MAG: hypothetical protein FWG71_03595, partial [Synergistaceae bacterium]|nr:hypothetical protein [Synergistaceae bacterium]
SRKRAAGCRPYDATLNFKRNKRGLVDMAVQTMNKADRENLVSRVGNLPDKFMLQIKECLERVEEEILREEAEEEERRYQEMSVEEIHAEIAALKAKYGTTPNAETIAAMKEVEDGLTEPVTIDELKAMLYALS